jgi:hypothetical protein
MKLFVLIFAIMWSSQLFADVSYVPIFDSAKGIRILVVRGSFVDSDNVLMVRIVHSNSLNGGYFAGVDKATCTSNEGPIIFVYDNEHTDTAYWQSGGLRGYDAVGSFLCELYHHRQTQ